MEKDAIAVNDLSKHVSYCLINLESFYIGNTHTTPMFDVPMKLLKNGQPLDINNAPIHN